MANQKLLKKVAPVVLSAAMVMTSMPAAAMAADLVDSVVFPDRQKTVIRMKKPYADRQQPIISRAVITGKL